MGNIVKLKLHFNGDSVLQKLEPFKDNWCPYNVKKDRVNNRWGLPLTSHTGDLTDNYHLNSFGYMQKYHDTDMHEENFNTPTEVYNSLPEISNIVEQFRPDIGRVHFLRVDQGGFFPPHRDFPGPTPEHFRLLAVFGKCKPENYVHLLDGKTFYPEPGFLYFVNFQLDHSVFSFCDGLHALILTVKVNQRIHDLIIKHAVSE
jgi:hypothetical protein